MGVRELDVASRFYTAVRFPEYLRPFRDTLSHISEVNEIECILVDYQLRCIEFVPLSICHTAG
jgi:hypothetical protein